jgi:pimeloyl-ACP methyl ester carboxylesterase
MKPKHAFLRAVAHQHRLALVILALTFTLAVAQSSGFQAFSASAANKTAKATNSLEKAAENLSQDQKKTAGESRFAKLDGARVHYVNYGKGDEALVLIHGWTMNVDNWNDQIPDLAKRNRVVAIDLPGHGQSDKPQISYSMDLFARAVEAVMRDAKVKRAVLVGHSMGTPVARQFYRKYPKKTLAIVVADGALGPFADKATMDRLINGFRGPNYREAVNQMFGMMKGGLSSGAVEQIMTSSRNTPHHVLLSAMEGMADMSIWGEDKINVPVLAIMARNPMFPPNMEEIYRAIAPNLDFRMWEAVGHFVMMEKPKEFNEAVLGFLDKHKLLQK